ncbi:hypothetical protein BH24ACI5_BH24ACI5_20560 [soil metagenome]
MRFWKTAVLSAAMVGAAAVGAAMAPVAHGQSPRVSVPRTMEVFSTFGGRIGVSVSDIEPGDAKGSTGVLIESVEDDSPAAKAGLKQGDIVVEFDGERVRSVRQFTRLVSETPAGRQVAAAVMRDGRRETVNLTTRERSIGNFRDFEAWMPAIPARPAPAPRTPRAPTAPRPPMLELFGWSTGHQLGVTVNDLSDQLGEYFGTKNGVLVSSVTEGSAAEKAGVKAGDVIVSVNGQAVDDAVELRRSMHAVEAGGEFTLNVMRDRKSLTLKGKLEPNKNRRETTRTIL